jgi:GT2 family glycosyltransferase
VSLSILIVNWNSRELLRNCLKSIRATCGGLNPQIIVVDGGSYDGCGEMIAAEFPEVEFIQSEKNIGFGRSNNLGASKVAGDALLLLNPDTELREDAVLQLLGELDRLSSAGVLGARLENEDGSIQPTSVHVLPTPLTEPFRSELFARLVPKTRLGGHAHQLRSTETVEVEAVSGACMMMRTAVFREVGGFTPEYFMYGEDMDLCLKIRRLGLRCFYVPAARVFHYGGASSVSVPNRITTISMREALNRYMLLNHGISVACLHRFCVFVSASLRFALAWPAWRFAPPRLKPLLRNSVARSTVTLQWSLGFKVPTNFGTTAID